MDIHNFQLSDIFNQNAKEYVTRPVKAMKYQPGLGIENGFCVHYSSTETCTREYMMYEGIRFFPSEADAWEFINRNEKQYVEVNGVLTEIEAVYDEPEPVLYPKSRIISTQNVRTLEPPACQEIVGPAQCSRLSIVLTAALLKP